VSDLSKNEELILLAIWKLGDNAYGVTIRENFKQVTGRTLNYGSMYNTLYLLVRKDLITSSESEPQSRKGGRRRVLYHLAPGGRDALARAQRLHRSAWGGVPDLAREEKK